MKYNAVKLKRLTESNPFELELIAPVRLFYRKLSRMFTLDKQWFNSER